ncbi:hypothetical protein EJ03DRAFT_51731 [Teratosphaeria nubilosa]|uniref:F-box domain-containing protein n=1 Tax=Teratosphaeria nubilosa TaxID=161662 RepID=A0A6G1LDG1_9PEZI|nr:hypothetical protein EJ03DRAFT_51731 [Teratosphaeria nubilosa]
MEPKTTQEKRSMHHLKSQEKPESPSRLLCTNVQTFLTTSLGKVARILSGTLNKCHSQETTSPLLSLPDEIWLIVMPHLNPVDQLSLRQSCRKFFSFCTSADMYLVRAEEDYRRDWLRLIGRDWYNQAMQLEAGTVAPRQRRQQLQRLLRNRVACAGCNTVHVGFAFQPWEHRKDGTQRQCYRSQKKLLSLHGGRLNLNYAELCRMLANKPSGMSYRSRTIGTSPNYSTMEISLHSRAEAGRSVTWLHIEEQHHLREPPSPHDRLCAYLEALRSLAIRLCSHVTPVSSFRLIDMLSNYLRRERSSGVQWWDTADRRRCRDCGMVYWFEPGGREGDDGGSWIVLKTQRCLVWPLAGADDAAWTAASADISGFGDYKPF